MSQPVELSVRSSLQKVIDELEKVKAKAAETGESFKQTGRGVGEELNTNVKRSETFFGQLRNLSRRIADQMRGDFKSLISLNALTDALKLSNQMRESVAQTIELSNKVRKLGTTFGIAERDFVSFQTKMSEGLGELGLDTDAAARALQGLSTTPVRGQQNLIQYSQASGMLASISSQKGREGDIAKGMAETIRESGGNANDPEQMAKLANTLKNVFVATGASPLDTLNKMHDLFNSMTIDTRKNMSPDALAKIAVISQQAGPLATSFIESYLGKRNIEKLPFGQQGGSKVFDKNGLNVNEFSKFFKDITSRIGFDPETSATTLGLTDEEAKGFVRLGEALTQAGDAQRKIQNVIISINDLYYQNMALAEGFAASLNNIKKELSEPIAFVTQNLTKMLSDASKTKTGSALVTGGAVLTAASLAGLALTGIGGKFGKAGGIASGVAQTLGAEQVFGTKAQPVYVTNFSMFPGGDGNNKGIIEGITNMMGTGGGMGLAADALFAGAAIPAAAIATIVGGVYGAMKLNDMAMDTFGNAGKEPPSSDSSNFSDKDIDFFRKMKAAGKISESKRANVDAILDDYDKHQAASRVMGVAQPSQNQTITSPGTAGGRSTNGGTSTLPIQKHVIKVESRNPYLKTTIQGP